MKIGKIYKLDFLGFDFAEESLDRETEGVQIGW